MVKIKGPIKLRMDGKPISSLIEEKVKELKTTPNLPFDAKGWKSEKNHALVKGGKKLAKKGEENIVTATKAKTKRKKKVK